MKEEEHIYDLIDEFLDNKLPPEHPFFVRLEQDKDLLEEVEVQKAIREAVIDFRLLGVKESIAQLKLKHASPTSNKWKKLILPSLGLALLALMGYYVAVYKEAITAWQINKTVPASDYPIPSTTPSPLDTGEEYHKPPKSVVKGTEHTTLHLDKEIMEEEILEEVHKQEQVGDADDVEKQEITLIENPDAFLETENPCERADLTFQIHDERTCEGSKNGSIRIEATESSKHSFHYSIDNGATFHKTPYFQHLGSGNYSILVRNEDGCTSPPYFFTLLSKNCPLFKQYDFNPTYAPLEMVLISAEGGDLNIYNKNGQRIYHATVGKMETFKWDGSNQQGQLMVPGLYIYHLNYSDGKMEHGNITIAY